MNYQFLNENSQKVLNMNPTISIDNTHDATQESMVVIEG